MVKTNLHTHTTYCDGKNTIEENITVALKKGFTSLGFSGHGTNKPWDEGSMSEEETASYLKELREAKQKYRDQLPIYIGIEQDSMHRLDGEYEYRIGSVHFLNKAGKYVAIDESKEIFEYLLNDLYHKDVQALIHDYYAEVARQADWDEVDIIGHIDLITKYNEEYPYFDPGQDWYQKEAQKAVDACIATGKIFEMNTGAISRGYRKEAYPDDRILSYIAKKNGKLCINTDAHAADNLDLGISDCLQRAKNAGFKTLWCFENGQFCEHPIEEFQGD